MDTPTAITMATRLATIGGAREIANAIASLKPALWTKLLTIAEQSTLHTVYNKARTIADARRPYSFSGQAQRPQDGPGAGLGVYTDIVVAVIVDAIGIENTLGCAVERLRAVVEAADRVHQKNMCAADLPNVLVAPGLCLCADNEYHASFALDPDGGCALAWRAHLLLADKPHDPCQRAAGAGRLTCYPELAIALDTLRQLYVPQGMTDCFLSWTTNLFCDLRREDQIHRTFRPSGPVSVSNVIGSGLCGGIQSDRRKKKKRVDVDATAPVAVTTTDEPVRQRQQKQKTASWGTTPATSVGGGGEAAKTKKLLEAYAAMETESTAATSDLRTLSPGHGGRPEQLSWIPALATDTDVAVVTAIEPRDAEAAFAQVVGTLRNPWVDAAWTRRFGTAWAHGAIPCGCAAQLVYRVVSVVRRTMAAKQQQAARVGVDVWSLVAFAMDIACGTLTRAVAEAPVFETAVTASPELYTAIALDVGAELRRMRDHDQSGAVNPWGCAVSLAKVAIAEHTMHRTDTVQPWYFAPVRRLHAITDAFFAGTDRGLYSRAEEIAAACAAAARESPSSSVASGHRRGGRDTYDPQVFRRRLAAEDGDPPSVALEFGDEGTAWPCDVAWAASLAADTLGTSFPAGCGHVVPLSGRSSIVALGGDIASDERAGTCSAECRSGADPSDAYVCGAMCHVLGVGRGAASVVGDCGLVYPFVYLVLAHGAAAREREFRHWARVDGEVPKKTDDGWDVLIRAAGAWLADICLTTASAAVPSGILAAQDADFPREVRRGECAVFGEMVPLIRNAATADVPLAEIARGIACVLYPRAVWAMDRASALAIERALGDATPLCVRVAVSAAVRGADGGIFGGQTIDAATRTALNVELVRACSRSRHAAAAAALLRAVRRHDRRETATVAAACGTTVSLSSYDPLAGYLACITELGTPATRAATRKRGRCGVAHSRPTAGAHTVPALRMLCEEYVREEEAGDSPAKTVLAVFRTLELERRRRQHRPTNDIGTCRNLAKKVFDACGRSWRARAVPLCEMLCSGAILSSADVVPVADCPYSLPGANPVECHACRTFAFPRQPARERTVSECLPPKHGPLMAELVHARNGAVVLPHALPGDGAKTSKQDGPPAKDYQVSLVRSIISKVRAGTKTPNALFSVCTGRPTAVVGLASRLRSVAQPSRNPPPAARPAPAAATTLLETTASPIPICTTTTHTTPTDETGRGSGVPGWLADIVGVDLASNFRDMLRSRRSETPHRESSDGGSGGGSNDDDDASASTDLVSTDLVSADLVSADLVSADLVSADLVSADSASTDFETTTTATTQ